MGAQQKRLKKAAERLPPPAPASAPRKPEWKDQTSYSQGERDKVPPRVWELELGPLRIDVHRLYYDPERWYVSCHDIGIKDHRLPAALTVDAQEQGVRVIREKLEAMLAAVKAAMPEQASDATA